MSSLTYIHAQLADALRKLLENPYALENREAAKQALQRYDMVHHAAEDTKRRFNNDHSHIVVGDRMFRTFHSAFTQAQKDGFNGTLSTLQARIKKRMTWEECVAPIEERYQKQHSRRTRQQKQEDLARELQGLPPLHLKGRY